MKYRFSRIDRLNVNNTKLFPTFEWLLNCMPQTSLFGEKTFFRIG